MKFFSPYAHDSVIGDIMEYKGMFNLLDGLVHADVVENSVPQFSG